MNATGLGFKLKTLSALDHEYLPLTTRPEGGSPGLVVMGRDSRFKGRGFDSRHHILDEHFFTYICCRNYGVCLKRPKINEKEAGVGPFFNKN